MTVHGWHMVWSVVRFMRTLCVWETVGSLVEPKVEGAVLVESLNGDMDVGISVFLRWQEKWPVEAELVLWCEDSLQVLPWRFVRNPFKGQSQLSPQTAGLRQNHRSPWIWLSSQTLGEVWTCVKSQQINSQLVRTSILAYRIEIYSSQINSQLLRTSILVYRT